MTIHAAANEIDALELRLSAAKERIRTLESECAILRNRADNAGHNVEALQDENNRLREALEKIARRVEYGDPVVRLVRLQTPGDIARAALAQRQEER